MRTRHTLRPSLEALEVRDTPAGTVNATFANGRLTLTGDVADNGLLIRTGPDQRLVITDNQSGTRIRLNGDWGDGTAVLPAPVTGAVVINLGDGADELVIEGVHLPGALSINGGNGSADAAAGNTVRLRDVRVGGGLAVTNRAGFDVTNLWGAVAVGGGLSIRNGPGGSRVWGDGTTDLRVGGPLTVVNGAGLDEVELGEAVGVAVGGLVVDSGPDSDGSYLRVHPVGDLVVAGGVGVTNGPGNDFTDLGGQNATVRGAVVIRNGDGGSYNSLFVRGALSVGSVAITSGTGEDFNEITSFDTAVIRGGVSFANGADADVTHNHVGGNNALTVGGGVTFANGSGRDTNSVFSSDVWVRGGVTVRTGDGDSDTAVGAVTRLRVGGPTRITAGVGSDVVAVGAGRVLGTRPAVEVGPVRVSVGDGGSDVRVRGGRLAVTGPLGISGGAGTDRVMVATEAESGSVTGGVTIAVGAGDSQLVTVGAATGRVLTVGGPLGITTANAVGFNWVELAGLDVRSGTTIATGAGRDEVRVTGSTFGGAFVVATGAGDDTVWIEWAGGATSIRGPARVSTGEGDDRVWALGDLAGTGHLEFGGSSTWDGGAGTGDVLGVRDKGNVIFHAEPTVTGFETAP